jgi:hypothetical protein
VRGPVSVAARGADACLVEGSLVGRTPPEIWVVRIKRHWFVRVDDEEIAIAGGKSDAVARAFSIAQLGDGPRDVVTFARDGSVEERRSFGH